MKINKYEILKTFVLMHRDTLISEIVIRDNTMLTYCDGSDIWWNFALVNHVISDDELGYIENFFKTKNRKSTIYFTDDFFMEDLVPLLKKRGYKQASKDSWLFWNKDIPDIDSNGIIEVKTREDFEKWIETFVRSYPKDDPQNPYGEQTGFAKVLKKSWDDKRKSEKYYLLFDDGKPVATAILTNYNKMGYVSGVGSVPVVRGRGFGKKISLHCVKESIKRGNKCHFLATEKGDYPYEFYKRIGFEDKFEAFLYTKKFSHPKTNNLKNNPYQSIT